MKANFNKSKNHKSVQDIEFCFPAQEINTKENTSWLTLLALLQIL